MSYLTYIFTPLAHYRKSQKISEEALAKLAGISRLTVRALQTSSDRFEVKSLSLLASALNLKVSILAHPAELHSEYSTVAASYKTIRDGETSWKTHFFELVDEFRRDLDIRLLLLPPPHELNQKLTALLGSIVESLCIEAGASCPDWASKVVYLEKPWFVAEMESLKAITITESPLSFRKNNIFVNDNFMRRV